MEIPKSYITDENGSIKAVMIDFEVFKRMENLLLDQGLAKAMSKVEEEEDVDLAEAKALLKD